MRTGSRSDGPMAGQYRKPTRTTISQTWGSAWFSRRVPPPCRATAFGGAFRSARAAGPAVTRPRCRLLSPLHSGDSFSIRAGLSRRPWGRCGDLYAGVSVAAAQGVTALPPRRAAHRGVPPLDPLLDRRRGAAARQLSTDLVGDSHGRENLGEKIRLADEDEIAEGRGVRDCSHGRPDCRRASRSRARSAWS